MKWILKWLFRLFILAVVLVVIAVLSVNPLLKALIENRIRTRTGMDAEIGGFSLGLIEPTVTIQNFKLYNPPDFGGTPFLDIREIHAEYDRHALRKHDLHITLLRFNLAELDIVKNQAGQTNIFSIAGIASFQKAGAAGRATGFLRQTGPEFTGIDVLNVSIGKARFIDLKDQRLNRTQKIGIENCIIKNVKSPADLAGLGALIWLRGGHTVGLPVNPPKPGPGTNQ
ncbi:MAG: hypothetical protein ABSD77_06360 [Verrucomicrobiota bacterium]|jgi:uncharacterized protein involved in outer membrane biogenesis